MSDRKDTQLRRARTLRRAQTEAERRLWHRLRDRRLAGFVCRERAFVVEIDGATHSTEEEIAYDARRTAFLKRKDFRVLRATDTEVYDNLDGVLETILAALGASESFVGFPGAPHPNPLPASGAREP